MKVRQQLLPAAALLLSACSETKPAAVRDSITIGVRADEYEHQVNISKLGMYPLNTNIGEPLVRLANDYSIEPLLATGWQYEGENRWRFHLRPGVRFSNGTPLTAEAVKWTVQRLARGEPHILSSMRVR